jgi:hypothetical protein
VSSVLDAAFLQQAFYYFRVARSAVMSQSQMDKCRREQALAQLHLGSALMSSLLRVERPQHALLEPHISLALETSGTRVILRMCRVITSLPMRF